MKGKSFGAFAVLSVFILFALGGSIQTTGQSADGSVSSAFFGGTTTADNRVTHSTNDVDLDFLNVGGFNSFWNGWFVFDGSITSKNSTGLWDVIITTPVNFSAELDVWENKTRTTSREECTETLSFTYPNGTEVLDKTCNKIMEDYTSFNWTATRNSGYEQAGSEHRITFKNVKINQGTTENFRVRIDRNSLPGHTTVKFSISAVPAGTSLDAAVAGKLGGGLDPTVNSSIDETAFLRLSNDVVDYAYGHSFSNTGVTFVGETIGTTPVTVAEFKNADNGDTISVASSINFTCKTGCSVTFWLKIVSAVETVQIAGTADTPNQWAIGRPIANNKMRVTIDTAQAMIASTSVPNSEWHFHGFSINSTHIDYYYDGVKNTTGVDFGGLPSGVGAFCIGAGAGTCASSWVAPSMNLSGFRYFNNTLSETQQSLLYNGGEPTNSTLAQLEGGSPPEGSANETEGDNAILTAINSSVPSATKYKTQKVYVVNSSNTQWQGTVDYLVVQTSPQRRWLLNYITTGESYLNAANLSSAVYVLEITNKTTAEITQEMSTFINATK